MPTLLLANTIAFYRLAKKYNSFVYLWCTIPVQTFAAAVMLLC